MSFLTKQAFAESDIPVLQKMLPEYLCSLDAKAYLYVEQVPAKLIALAAAVSSDDVCLQVLGLLESFFYEQQDLVNVSGAPVIDLCISLLKSSSLKKRAGAFKLLQPLCQMPENAQKLTVKLDLFQIAHTELETLSYQTKALGADYFEYIQTIVSFLYIFCTVNEKFQTRLVQCGFPKLLSWLLRAVWAHSDALAVVLGFIYLISQSKAGVQALLENQIEAEIAAVFLAYMDGAVRSEAAQIAANVVATSVAVAPKSVSAFFDKKIPSSLYTIASEINKQDDKLLAFVISALTELLYAANSAQFQTLQKNITQIGQIDDFLQFCCSLPEKFQNPAVECYNVFGILVSLLGNVPKSQDFIRVSILQRGVIPIIINGLQDKDTPLQSKIMLLDALSELIKRQPIPPQIQVTEMPACTATVLKLKREFANLRGKKSEDKAMRMHATESAKLVLERLGHSEGRNTQKMQMYTMFAIGVVMLCVALVKGIFWGWK